MSEENDVVAMTIEVVASYVAHNTVRPDDLPGFIAQTHAAIAALNAAPEPELTAAEPDAAAEHEPAVSVRRSLASRDHIISMIDGKPYKTLKRHIGRHGMTPAEYRERYGLKADYPMVAPAYSEHRREAAKTLGLGRKPKVDVEADVVEPDVAEPEAQTSEAAASPEPAIAEPTVAEPAKAKRKPKAKPAADQSEPQPAKRRGRQPKSAAPTETPADDQNDSGS